MKAIVRWMSIMAGFCLIFSSITVLTTYVLAPQWITLTWLLLVGGLVMVVGNAYYLYEELRE